MSHFECLSIWIILCKKSRYNRYKSRCWSINLIFRAAKSSTNDTGYCTGNNAMSGLMPDAMAKPIDIGIAVMATINPALKS